MEIEFINTQKVLSLTNITIGDYAINPYRGCEFNCIYCYSKENKNLNTSFKVGIKINAIELLKKEIYYKNPKRIILGSTTECFQYKELEYKITEGIIRVLNEFNIPYTILTKSHLIEKYLDLISINKNNQIYFTLNFVSNKVIRTLEEKTPSFTRRIKTIKKILEKNINLRIHIGPFIPYLSSLEEIIKNLPEEIREVNIELYNNRMGNFKSLIEEIEKEFGKEFTKKILNIYSNRENYLNFSKELEKEIKEYKKNTKIKFCYIVPEFDSFYSKIDYNNFL